MKSSYLKAFPKLIASLVVIAASSLIFGVWWLARVQSGSRQEPVQSPVGKANESSKAIGHGQNRQEPIGLREVEEQVSLAIEAAGSRHNLSQAELEDERKNLITALAARRFGFGPQTSDEEKGRNEEELEWLKMKIIADRLGFDEEQKRPQRASQQAQELFDKS